MKIFVLLVIFNASHVFAEKKAELCPLTDLREYDYSDMDCQFYLGTKAYRAGIYEIAAAHWTYVVESETVYEGDDELQSRSFSNLNFLIYEGLGVDEDKDLAVKNWIKAVQKGSFEARRHLAVAYSDDLYKNKDLIKSLAWYLTVTSLSSQNEDNDKYDKATVNLAKEGIKEVTALMSDNEITEAKKLSVLLLNNKY